MFSLSYVSRQTLSCCCRLGLGERRVSFGLRLLGPFQEIACCILGSAQSGNDRYVSRNSSLCLSLVVARIWHVDLVVAILCANPNKRRSERLNLARPDQNVYVVSA
jgi:hypothetical protein